MNLAPTNILSSGSGSGATSYATASFTPVPNVVHLATFLSRTSITADPTQPTATGCGLTWTLVATVVYDNTSLSRRRMTMFRGVGPAPTTGAITFDEAGQAQTTAEWVVDQINEGTNSGTNGSDLIVQSVTNFDGSATVSTLTTTLAAFGNINNGTYGVCAIGSNDTITPGANFTQLANTSSSIDLRLVSMYNLGNQTAVNFTCGINDELGGIAAELKFGKPSLTLNNYQFLNAGNGISISEKIR